MLSDHCFFSPIFISLISSFKFLRSGFLRPDLCEIKFRANSDPNSAFLMHIYFIVECSTSEHQLFVAAYLHSRAILPFEKRRGVHSRRRSRIPRPSGWLHCGEKRYRPRSFLHFSVLFKLLSGGVLLCHLLRRSFVTSLCLFGVLAVCSHEIRFRTFPYTM